MYRDEIKQLTNIKVTLKGMMCVLLPQKSVNNPRHIDDYHFYRSTWKSIEIYTELGSPVVHVDHLTDADSRLMNYFPGICNDVHCILSILVKYTPCYMNM